MKKLFIIILLLTAVLSACKKEKSGAFDVVPVFEKPDELLQKFVSTLDQGTSGWAAILNPKSGKSYSMFFLMDGNDQVLTLVDLDVTTARQAKGGTYKLHKGATAASISFSSGTYLDDITHKENFRTISADTSYAFKYTKGDTVVLIGNQHGDELKLINITSEEAVDYQYGILGNSYIYLFNYFSQKRFFSTIAPDNVPVQVALNPDLRSINLLYVKDGKVAIHSTDYAYGVNRILLKVPVQIGKLWVQEIPVDTKTGAFYIPNGNEKLVLTGSSLPILPLHLMIGTAFPPVISLPSPAFVEELPGWSPAFTDIWFTASGALESSDFQSQLLVMAFNLDTKKKLMNLDILFAIGQTVYQGTFPMSYTKSAGGTYKFEALPLNINDPAQGNASLILPYVKPLLDIVVSDSFDMDYYEYGEYIMAQMKSVSHPDIYFTGYMASYQ